MRPRLSVCIPATENWSDYVRRTAAAFACQTVDAGLIEVCVGVDGDSSTIREALDDLRIETKVGEVSGRLDQLRRNHARNVAWHLASGEICWMLDADILVPPHAVEHLLEEHDAALDRGLSAVFSPCMEGIIGRPADWRRRASSWSANPTQNGLIELIRTTKSRDDVYSGYAKSYSPGHHRSLSRPDMLEGMPCVPRWILEALGGFCEEFVGWGGNKEEFVDRLKTLNVSGIVDIRLLCSVLALHQPHARPDKADRRKNENHRLRARRLRQIRDGANWWKVQESIAKDSSKAVMKELSTDGGIHVIITTCERPTLLASMLRDLVSSADKSTLPVSVAVYDDASQADYTEVKTLLKSKGWGWLSAQKRHGKKLFWHWVDKMMGDQRHEPARYWVWLPDDERLCDDFFNRIVAKFESVDDPKKVSLGFFVDENRHDVPGWTGITPHKLNGAVMTGWVDGNFISNRRFLDELGFTINRVNSRRWDKKPTLSSGVWAQASDRLFKRGASMYHTEESMVVHVANPSIMNPVERAKNPMRVRGFVDGDASANTLSRDGEVWASLASIPSREASLQRVVSGLKPQVDRLNIFLNGYDSIPDFLDDEDIVVERSQDHGNVGDVGKVFWAQSARERGVWHFLCDDDLVYPADYVITMIEHAESRSRRAVVGVHGRIINPRPKSYYAGSKMVAHFGAEVRRPLAVNVLGTGCLCYHTSTIEIPTSRFVEPNMADVFFAILAKEQDVPLVAVPRPAQWIRQGIRGSGGSIYETSSKNDEIQSRFVSGAAPWAVIPDPVPVHAKTTPPVRRSRPLPLPKPTDPISGRPSKSGESTAEAVHKFASKLAKSGRGEIGVVGEYAHAAMASMKGRFVLADFDHVVNQEAKTVPSIVACGILDGLDQGQIESRLAMLSRALMKGAVVVMAEFTALGGGSPVPPVAIQRALPGIGVKGTRRGWGGIRTILYGRLAK